MKKLLLLFILFSTLTFGQNYTIKKNFDGSISLSDDKDPMKSFTMIPNGEGIYVTNDLNVMDSYTLTRLNNDDFKFTSNSNPLNSYTIRKNSDYLMGTTYSTTNDFDVFDSYTTRKNIDGSIITTNDFNVFDSSTMRYNYDGTSAQITRDYPNYNQNMNGAYADPYVSQKPIITYQNPYRNSGGAYQNPTEGTVDYNAFARGFARGFSQSMNFYAAISAIEAERKRKWDNKVNISPDFDFTRGSYKKFSLKKGNKKYEIKYFKPPYWLFYKKQKYSTRVRYFDALFGRPYSDGRNLKFWMGIQNKLGGLEPSFYIEKEKKSFNNSGGFKRYVEMNLFGLPNKTIILINENVTKNGNKVLVGKCLNSINDMLLIVRFEIHPNQNSNIEFEFQRLIKVINYTLNNISII